MNALQGLDWQDLLDKVADGLMVRTDSRLVRPGEVFVALPGARHGAGDFIPDAVARGAAYVVAPPEVAAEGPEGVTFIHRPDPRQALGEMAKTYFRTDTHSLKVVGVTGTNGKTTVAFLVEHLLTSAGLKVGLLGTVSYRWPGFMLKADLTTPDCWQLHELMYNMEKSDVDLVVMEVSSHALDQQRVAGLEFELAALTNLTQDHLDYHKDMETYARTKSKLFLDCPKPGKAAVLNYDDEFGRRLLADCSPAMGYGLSDPPRGDHSVLRGSILSSSGRGLHLGVAFQDKTWETRAGLVGLYNASNLLAAQAVGLNLGLRPRDMKKLCGFAGVPGRLERVANDKGLDIFIDFAHTPDALANVQSTLKGLGYRRLITLFGCGGDRDRAKRPLMGQAVARFADLAVLTTDNPRTEQPSDIIGDVLPGLADVKEKQVIENRREAIAWAVKNMRPGDVLLLAGKGHENYQDIMGQKLPFSDREEAEAALAEIE